MEKQINKEEPLTEKTAFPDDTYIEGDIKCAHDLVFVGTCVGNIFCNGTLELRGKVEGQVHADTIIVEHDQKLCQIIHSKEVLLKKEHSFDGMIESENFIVQGQFAGSAFISGMLEVGEQAVVRGEITTKYIEIRNGSKISASIHIINEDVASSAL